jgi:hypothetical protein
MNVKEKIKLNNQPDQFIPEKINPDNLEEVADYFKFEMDQGFTQLNPDTTFEGMVKYRQRQIREGKMQIATIKQDKETLGTVVVVLENGTMGKKLKPDEAWASGNVVKKEKRSMGLGRKLAETEENIAREAGKNSILTHITQDNFSSMRVYMNIGYRLEGVDKREHETNYLYRKNLDKREPSISFLAELKDKNLNLFEGDVDETTPDEVLVDPLNNDQIEKMLDANYRGVCLIRPEEVNNSEIKSNMIVFARQISTEEKEKQFQGLKTEKQAEDEAQIKKILDDINKIK